MTAAAHVPYTFRNRPIGPTGAERVGRPSRCHTPRYRALLSKAIWGSDRLDITISPVTPDGAVQEWERES